jgi:hypothetical protein
MSAAGCFGEVWLRSLQTGESLTEAEGLPLLTQVNGNFSLFSNEPGNLGFYMQFYNFFMQNCVLDLTKGLPACDFWFGV